jgi:MFS family permease
VGGRRAVGISVVWVALAFLGDGLTALVLPTALGDRADAATAIGLISFAGLGLAVIVQPFAGRLSDALRGRLDRRWFIAIFAVPVVLGLVPVAADAPLPAVAAAYLLVMVAASAVQAGQQTLIPEHAPRPWQGRAASLKTAFDIGGAFVAFLVLGLLLEAGGVPSAVVVVAIVLILSVALLLWAVPRDAPAGPAPVARGSLVGLPAGFWRPVLSRFLFLFGVYAVGRFLLLLVADRVGIPPERAAAETGGMLALFTVTTAVAALALGPVVDRVGRRPLMVGGALIAAAGTALFIIPAGLAGALAAGLLMSLGTAAFTTANWAALTELTPVTDAGRLLGIANIGTGGAAACAGLLGPSIDAAGFTPALLVASVAIVASLAPIARPLRAARMEASTT